MSDMISRQAAIDGLEKYHEGADLHIDGLTYAYDLICKLPSVSTEKTGRWIKDDKEHGHCSLCGFSGVDLTRPELTNFCSNCGAKMEVEE